MKLFRFGLIAAVLMAFTGYGVASAAGLDAGQKTQGMKDAPAVLQSVGLTCDLSDAYFVGNGTSKVDGKDVASKVYEVACKNGPGYFIVSSANQPAQFYTCLALKTMSDQTVAKGGKPGQMCVLPENANPATGLTPLLATASSPPCSVTSGRWIGGSATDKIDIYEARCSDNRGYVFLQPQPGSTKKFMAVTCAEAGLFGSKCALTSDDEIKQQIMALAKPSNPAACQMTGARWLLTTTDGSGYYEIGCADGKSGYIFEAAGGAPKQVIPCAKAQNIGGGCTLTDADVAQTAEANIYTQQAKQIGYPCTVSKYQSLGFENGAAKREVVELACKENAGSVWSLLPTGSGGDPTVMNCLRAVGALGLPTCKLSKPADTYANLSAEIKSKGKTCTVTNARYITGVRSQSGEDFVEVACSEGSGMIVAYAPKPIETVADVFTCKEAAGTNRACTLSK
ncbi:MAG TPA: hypothetical protein VMU59_00855 [Caulobacteraceae bacterium]|nr:hypothetical protein [Caulobacteraceae bacterium]